MLVPPQSSSAVLVMISSKPVSICNRFRARLVDSSRNRAFWMEYSNAIAMGHTIKSILYACTRIQKYYSHPISESSTKDYPVRVFAVDSPGGDVAHAAVPLGKYHLLQCAASWPRIIKAKLLTSQMLTLMNRMTSMIDGARWCQTRTYFCLAVKPVLSFDAATYHRWLGRWYVR